MQKMTTAEFIAAYRNGRRHFYNKDLTGIALSYGDFYGLALRNVKLSKAMLFGTTFSKCTFYKVDLSNSNMLTAKFRDCKMTHVTAKNADMRNTYVKAHIKNSDFRSVSFTSAIISDSKLINIDFTEASLYATGMPKKHITNCTLTRTCLDPKNRPNGYIGKFEKYTTKRGHVWVIGYRTKNAVFTNRNFVYQIGKTYKAPVFSTSYEPCHPGLYLFPSVQAVLNYTNCYHTVIKVVARKEDVHKAGDKWRARSFRVVEDL